MLLPAEMHSVQQKHQESFTAYRCFAPCCLRFPVQEEGAKKALLGQLQKLRPPPVSDSWKEKE